MKPKQWFAHLLPVQKVALGFVAVILTGMILLSLPVASQNGESIGFLNALFTSTSATCVTGLVVLDTGTTFSMFGQIVILFLIQTGGLGFMTMATLFFIAVKKRITLRERLVIAESMNTDSMAGLVRLMKTTAVLAFSIEGVGMLLMMIRFIPDFGLSRGIYVSIFMAISSFCNAGFDPMGNFTSLTAYTSDPLINFTVMALIIIGGLGFAVVSELLQRKRCNRLSLHTKMVITMAATLVVVGTVLFTALEWNNPATIGNLSVGNKFMAGAFQSVTTRTAGFNTISQSSMMGGSKLLSMFLMFIGAAPASTGGGIKVTTFACVLIMTYCIVRGSKECNIGNRRLSRDVIRRAAAIVTLGISLVIVATLVISMLEPGFSMEAILYEVFSAFGTVGLSFGITPSLHPLAKLVIIVVMFCGRVGPLTVSIALARRYQREDYIRYPQGRIMVG